MPIDAVTISISPFDYVLFDDVHFEADPPPLPALSLPALVVLAGLLGGTAVRSKGLDAARPRGGFKSESAPGGFLLAHSGHTCGRGRRYSWTIFESPRSQ